MAKRTVSSISHVTTDYFLSNYTPDPNQPVAHHTELNLPYPGATPTPEHFVLKLKT
jgi:hypothetical protein